MPSMNTEQLRQRIPGWGVDADPANRPGVPRESKPHNDPGVHWVKPERQVAKVKIHKSTEHKMLTPVFGTACPPSGLSGLIRNYAYKFSEGNKVHWLLLLGADRVNVMESALGSLLRGRPDNPFSEMGLGAEFRRQGFPTRFGQHRADVRRLRTDILVGLGVCGVGAVVANRAGWFRKEAREEEVRPAA